MMLMVSFRISGLGVDTRMTFLNMPQMQNGSSVKGCSDTICNIFGNLGGYSMITHIYMIFKDISNVLQSKYLKCD